MKKLAYGDGVVYVGLTTTEFKGLANGQSYSEIPDGTDVSLVHIKQKLDLVDAKEAEIVELKAAASVVIDKITAIGL